MEPSLIDKMFTAEVTGKRQLNHKIIELDLKLVKPSEINFMAGQFAMFVAGERLRRAYSIISPPQQKGALSFCVDISPMGPGSLLVRDIKIGEGLHLQAPFGVFTAPDGSQDVLFVATGAGIAPFYCMITEIFRRGFDKKATLLFGVHSEQEVFYFEYFAQLASKHTNFEFIPAIAHPEGEWHGERGRVTQHLSNNLEKYKDRLMYVCGNADMIRDVRALMLNNGVRPSQIKIEVFH